MKRLPLVYFSTQPTRSDTPVAPNVLIAIQFIMRRCVCCVVGLSGDTTRLLNDYKTKVETAETEHERLTNQVCTRVNMFELP